MLRTVSAACLCFVTTIPAHAADSQPLPPGRPAGTKQAYLTDLDRVGIDALAGVLAGGLYLATRPKLTISTGTH